MKTFKDIKQFKEKLIKGLCWEDYFKIGNLTYKIYEYGDLENCNYVYFYNKYSKTMLFIKYDCPASRYENGIKIITKEYRFISLEVLKNPYLWRTDTL
jgi:hypothetical protein